MITISLSPNTDRTDVWRAISLLFKPWLWFRGQSILRVKTVLCDLIQNSQIYTFNSGRSALYVLLKALGIGKGDEVLLQAFTCIAVPNCILWTGATPVYVDIDNTLNIDPDQVEKNITTKTKAIIIQHTFGNPAVFREIQSIAKNITYFLLKIVHMVWAVNTI